MKKPKLTAEEWQLLYELNIASAGRPAAEYANLIKQGLAFEGKGRFGDWIQTTIAGTELIKSRSFEENNACSHVYHDRMYRPSRAASEHTAPPKTVSPPSQSKRRKTEPDRPTGNPIQKPNALRVTLGTRVTYYPISAAASIKHGTQDFVVTSNKLYKSYTLGSPTTDLVVPA